LLAATHKDALAHIGDVNKVAQRLASAASEMFRDA
jgi:hypothetical protein